MSIDRPQHPHLLDLLRGREGDLTPLTLRIIDVALGEGAETSHPADIQAAALAAAASLIVMLTPSNALPSRAREAEGMFKRLIFAQGKRIADAGLDLAAGHREMHANGLGHVFGDAWLDLMKNRPIPQKWVDRGVASPEHFRKVLMSGSVLGGLSELFERIFGEQAVDYAAATLACVDASATMCAALYDTNQFDDEGFADLVVGEFRNTLNRSIAYWRERKAN